MDDLKKRIEYLKKELAAREGQDGWMIKGLQEELKRLQAKAEKQTKVK